MARRDSTQFCRIPRSDDWGIIFRGGWSLEADIYDGSDDHTWFTSIWHMLRRTMLQLSNLIILNKTKVFRVKLDNPVLMVD